MTNQKGLAPIILVVLVFIGLAGAFYFGTKVQEANMTQPSNSPAPSPQPSTQSSPSPKATMIVKINPSIIPKPNITAAPFDYGDYYWKMFPPDIPVYPGAKRASYYPQGQCKDELLKANPNCLQTNFMFKVTNVSVESVVNWYVGNPAPGWTYRGVYGDQRDYQFGDVYKNTRDIYYRMIYKYPNPDKTELEIYYNGPYPYSDLSPAP